MTDQGKILCAYGRNILLYDPKTMEQETLLSEFPYICEQAYFIQHDEAGPLLVGVTPSSPLWHNHSFGVGVQVLNSRRHLFHKTVPSEVHNCFRLIGNLSCIDSSSVLLLDKLPAPFFLLQTQQDYNEGNEKGSFWIDHGEIFSESCVMRGNFEEREHKFLDATILNQTPYVLAQKTSGERFVGVLERDSCICHVNHDVAVPEMPLSRLEKVGEGLVGIVVKEETTDFAFIHPHTGKTTTKLNVYGRTTDIVYDESTRSIVGIDDEKGLLRVYEVIFDSAGIPCDVKQRKTPAIKSKPFSYERRIELKLQSLTSKEVESVRMLVQLLNESRI